MAPEVFISIHRSAAIVAFACLAGTASLGDSFEYTLDGKVFEEFVVIPDT